MSTKLDRNYFSFSNKTISVMYGCLVVLVLSGFVYYTTHRSDINIAKITTVPQTSDNTVTVWSWNTAAKSLEELVPAFNKLYPDIKVKVVEIAYEDANANFRLSTATGHGFPDIMTSEAPLTPEYVKAGALLDITDLASKYKNSFVPYKWGEVSTNQKIYGIPWDTGPVGLFYRRDLFKAAGINADAITTWDEFIAAGQKLTQAPNIYMMPLSNKKGVSNTFEILLSEEGGSPFDDFGNPTFNSPQGVAALNLMKKMYNASINDNVSQGSPTMFADIKSGKIATVMQAVWFGGQLKNQAPDTSGKWGVIPLPATTPGGVRTAIRGGSNLAIDAKSKHVANAWKFIEFVLANETSQMKMYKDFDLFPSLKSVYTDPAFTSPDPFFANQVVSSVYANAQASLPPTYHYGYKYSSFVEIVSKEIINAINNTKTAQQALDDATVLVKAALK